MGACCPPKRVDYDTPEGTLRTWQAQLCHDDPVEEYGCLSSDLKQQMAGYQTYSAARRLLLEQEPLLAWLVQRVDLIERAESFDVDDDAGTASMTFVEDGERYEVHFVRETWVVYDTGDDPQPTARLPRSMAEVVYQQGQRQVMNVDRPLLDPDQIRRLRGFQVETRWKIDFLSGLQPPTSVMP